MPLYLQISIALLVIAISAIVLFKIFKKRTPEPELPTKNGEELEQEVIDFFEVKTEVGALKGMRDKDK